MTLIRYGSILIVGLVLVGCMGPEVEWVPASITILDAQVTDVTTSTAVVSWVTNHAAWSRVQIIDQSSLSNTVLDPTMTVAHRIELKDLQPAAFYLLIVQSSNSLGAGSAETGLRLIFQTAPAS